MAMNLGSALKAVEFCAVLERNESNRPTKVLVPGHEGRQYEVKITRNPIQQGERPVISVECHQKDIQSPCLGNSNGKICYHCIAALLKSCEKQGWLSFCDTRKEAEYISCFANGLYIVRSSQGTGQLYTLWNRFLKKRKTRTAQS